MYVELNVASVLYTETLLFYLFSMFVCIYAWGRFDLNLNSQDLHFCISHPANYLREVTE